MPLERFIPKSPDPFIRNSQDFEVAKFGHLNTIIEYVNTYVVTDSLQLDGTGPLTSTARYITDSLGNASSLAISTGNIGIGTTNATARLRVISADTNGIAEFFQNGFASSPLHLTRYTGLVGINLNTAAGGSASPVPVGDNIQMSRITTNTYNGTTFANSARIEVLTKGIQSATNYGSVMRFLTTPENATSMNEVMSLTSDGNVQIGIGYLVAGGAKLAVKGSGSTSATSSLLVQNSGGTESLKVQDDNIVRTTYLGIGGGTSTNNIGGTHIAQFGNAVSAGDQIIVVDSVSGSKRGFKFGNQGTIRMALIQDGVNLQIGNYVNPSAFVPYTTFDYLTGNVGIGTTSPTAKNHIVGSGSTSATTSLLVQNSSGTAALTVDDSRNVIVNGQFDVTGTSNFRVLTTAANVSLRFGPSPAISYNASEMYFAGSQFFFQLGTDFRFSGRGIFGSQTFNGTAQLQVDSTTKGFLPPRMTTAQRTAIVSPAAGLIVYDTDTNKSYTYDGTAWQAHY